MQKYLLILLLGLSSAVAGQESEDGIDPDYPDETGVSAYDDSQDAKVVSYELGEGVQFQLNGGQYEFSLGAFVQPYADLRSGNLEDTLNPNSLFGVQAARLFLEGKAHKEKASFRLDMDFTDGFSLLEAWVGFRPWEFVAFSFGQKLVNSNNREYINQESNLQFPIRSALSNYFTQDGRELGVFVDGFIDIHGVLIRPSLGLTSGDGRNSFGELSTDPDIGGLKLLGRIDFLPLGDFSGDGANFTADLFREPTPKLVIGAAASINNGASGKTGEAHGAFQLWDGTGTVAYADYEKLYVDLLFKYQGFSLLAEFVNARIVADQILYLDPVANEFLDGANIADNYVVGQGINVQLGYVFEKGTSIDLRYSTIMPEFDVTTSQLAQENWYTAGISHYFNRMNGFKLSGSVTYRENTTLGEATGEPFNGIFGLIMAQIML
ncbi:MAG: hypothetical protein GC205_13255 [Bacteroidetes bacterium]|nr:hypothetical protein [Bacteroidota bacterium]